MKRILYILAIMLTVGMGASAQTLIERSDGTFTQGDQYLAALKTLSIPYGVAPTFDGGLARNGSLFFNTTTKKLMVWTGASWENVGKDTDLSDYYTASEVDGLLEAFATTAEMNTALSLKVDKTTTVNGKALSGNIVIEQGDIPGLVAALAAKQNTVTGAASTVVDNNLTANRAVISNGSGKIAASPVTANELSYLGGVTSSIQAQLDAKLNLTGGTVTGVIKSPAPVADADLANKGYVDSQSMIEALDEGNGIGYRIRGRNPDHYGNIGLEAVDFSFNSINSTTGGATGSYSSAFGYGTTASGIGSSAFGSNTTASGDASVAFGANTTASGIGSSAFGALTTASSSLGTSAFGYGTTASGQYSSAFGSNTTASGDASVAFGATSIASGQYSSAFGAATEASGVASASFGEGAISSGNYSTAFGVATTASGSVSAAFGNTTTASGNASSAFGVQSIANEYASLAIGRYPTGGSVEAEWTTGSPIFKVGNGTGTGHRSNAYVLYNDGRSEQIKDVEVTQIGQGFVLKSPDGTRWRITVDNSGNLTTTSL